MGPATGIIKANAWAVALITLLMMPNGGVAQNAESCSTIAGAMAPCFSYLTTGSNAPSEESSCCKGVSYLNSLATSQAARQNICRCLQSSAAAAAAAGKPILQSSVDGLPGNCRVNIAYSLKADQDCGSVS